MEAFKSFNIESFFGLDIAFVIDSTGSMMSYINGAKESIKEIMTQCQIRFKNNNAEEKLLKFGVVAYRDHEPQDHTFVTKISPFEGYSETINFLDSLVASGGGDPPEAVLDALNDAVFNLNWREESEKMLFLLLDNPGHGIRFGTKYDCPCGLNEERILPVMKSKQICFHIIKPKENNPNLEKMIEIFQNYMDLETIELEKYKKIIVNYERISNEKNVLRGRFNSLNKKLYSSSSLSSGMDKEKSLSMKMSRSRSRSRSKEMKEDKGKEKLGKRYSDDSGSVSPYFKGKGTPLISISKDYYCEDLEMNIESGIKDHISKVVIDKLNRYLDLNRGIKENDC